MSPSCFHDCHFALFTTLHPQGLGSLQGPCKGDHSFMRWATQCEAELASSLRPWVAMAQAANRRRQLLKGGRAGSCERSAETHHSGLLVQRVQQQLALLRQRVAICSAAGRGARGAAERRVGWRRVGGGGGGAAAGPGTHAGRRRPLLP